MGTIVRICILTSCLVSISVAMTIVQTTTSESPPDTTSENTPPETPTLTTPSGCENKPKPIDEGPCSPCECDSNGEWACVIYDCMVAQCVDAYTDPVRCCPVCPTGPNCMIEGKIVPFDVPEVMPDGRVCYCTQEEMFTPPTYKCDIKTSGPEETTPPVTPEETTTPAGCLIEPQPDNGPCAFCECQLVKGEWQWNCYYRDCMRPDCEDYYTPYGECCPVCKDPSGCKLDDIIIPEGQFVEYPNGNLCYCEQAGDPVTCKPAPTPPIRCREEDKPTGPCFTIACECENWSGSWEWQCPHPTCPPPPCTDFVTSPDQCCPYCPNGPNCDINGVIVSVNNYIETPDAQVCFCVEKGSMYRETAEVQCMPKTTIPPTPPTTTEENCLNQPQPDNGPCVFCECLDSGDSWKWNCYPLLCMIQNCYQPYTPPGACCPICKEPPGCFMDDILIPYGEHHVNQNGEMCYCDQPGVPIYCEPVSPTPQPTSTPPSGCKEENKPTGPCFSNCECADWSGSWKWECAQPTCPPPPCADPSTSPDRCCPFCANGANCDVNGIIVPVGGFTETPNDEVCYCLQPNPIFFSEDVGGYIGKTEVQCTPISTTPMITTTPDAGCLNQPPPPWGLCAHCECVNWSGRWEWQCYHSTCMMPQCVDPTSIPGGCCLICENGPNCEINGQIVAVGDVLVGDYGEICYCAFSEESKFVCEPPPTTTTTQTTPPADCDPTQKPAESPCTSCECARWLDQPQWVCLSSMCAPPPCVDSSNVPSQCCPVCPNGPNCQAGDYIISVNETRRISDDLVCQCVQSNPWDVPTAVCMTVTTTSTTTTPIPTRKSTSLKTTKKPTTQKPTTTKKPITQKPTTTKKPTTQKPTTTKKTTTQKPTTTKKPITQKQTTTKKPKTPKSNMKPTSMIPPTTTTTTTTNPATTTKSITTKPTIKSPAAKKSI